MHHTKSKAPLSKGSLLVVVVAIGLGLSPAAEAALVAWSPVQTITSNLDILNPGSVIVARDYGNAGSNISVAVGTSTVTFVPASTPFNSTSGFGAQFFDPTGTTVAPDFDSVLDSFSYSYAGDGGGTETLPFTGLTPGGSYLLQVFTSDDRNLTWNTRLDIDGVQQTIYTDSSGASTFANATITLGGGESSFTLTVTGLTSGPGGASSSNFDLALVNAIVLSQVPEPASLSLMGLGGLALLRRIRKSREKRVEE
jgi:hypothetical protein